MFEKRTQNWFGFENSETDLPFYNGEPYNIHGTKWLLAIIVCLCNFAFLEYFPSLPISNLLRDFLKASIFSGVFILVALFLHENSLKYLFRPLKIKDFKTIFLVFIVNIVVVAIVATILNRFIETTPNAAIETLRQDTPVVFAVHMLIAYLQLIGEELLTIIPFLAVLQFTYAKIGLRRSGAIIVAWVLSSLLFGAMHIPAYGGNIAQALIVISLSRAFLTYAYIKTRNIWVSFIIHVLVDTTAFLIAVLVP